MGSFCLALSGRGVHQDVMAISLTIVKQAAVGIRAMTGLLLAALLALPAASVARAQSEIRVGISAPLTDYFSVIGDQIEAGTRAARDAEGTGSLEFFDDACEPEAGARTAEAMVAAGVAVAIGYPCIESFDMAMPILADADIPLILLGVQSEAIAVERRKGNWPVLRLAPKSADEADAIADYMKRAWRDVNFAIIDDGTLYGRELAEAVRFRMEEDSLKPVFADTYRPQLDNQVALVRRLRKAGATHVFVGGDASDAAIIGVDAARIGIPLTLAGGTAFLAPASAGTLADGTALVALPAWPDVMDKPSDEDGMAVSAAHPGNNYLVPAYAALQIALAIFEGKDPAEGFFFGDLLGRTFDTVLGPISFDGNGDVSRNLFRIFVIEDGKPVLAEAGRSTGSIQ